MHPTPPTTHQYTILGSDTNTDKIFDDNGDVMWGCYWKPDYSNNTWVALLAKEFGIEYNCYASPGSSNHTILRELLNNIQSFNKGDLVIVNWTWIDRWDMVDINDNKWVTLRANSDTDTHTDTYLHRFYFKYIQSELWNKLETLKNMALVIDILKNIGVNFIMTCLDNIVTDEQYHAPQYILELQSMVVPNLTWFDGDGFYDWSNKNNFSVGETGHPLEDAHTSAFNYIKNNYDFS
jgi:hypothetical protein